MANLDRSLHFNILPKELGRDVRRSIRTGAELGAVLPGGASSCFSRSDQDGNKRIEEQNGGHLSDS